MRTKEELKQILRIALQNEYGFAPSASRIALLEASGDGRYILANVGGKEYRFDSYFMTPFDGGKHLWTGKGTITKL